MEPIRAIVYGVGSIGKTMTKLMVEKGIIIVGAIGHRRNIGQDLGDIAELGYRLNVKISDNADAVLSEQEADIAVVAIFDDMARTYPIYKRCIENGVNVISTGSEASYPWLSAPELTSKLDKLAKKKGVTISGSGNQDIYMVDAGILLTGASHRIESITVRSVSNTESFGLEVARLVHVGETKDEFDRKIKESGEESSCVYLYFLENVISALGLTIRKIEILTEPTIDDEDLESKVLGEIVKKGLVTGTHQTVEIDTEQGIKFYGDYIFKLRKPDEKDEKEWIIKGLPDLSLKFSDLSNELTTCTQTVNRIPDVINSEPGFITIENFPMLKFRTFPLHYYVTK